MTGMMRRLRAAIYEHALEQGSGCVIECRPPGGCRHKLTNICINASTEPTNKHNIIIRLLCSRLDWRCGIWWSLISDEKLPMNIGLVMLTDDGLLFGR